MKFFSKLKAFLCSKKVSSNGFTLAELVISLLILTLIATFGIQKILAAQVASTKSSIFKETLSAMEGSLFSGVLNDSVAINTVDDWMFGTINALIVCNVNATAQNCWGGQAVIALGSEETEPGFLMHNGAQITGIDNGTDLGGGVQFLDFVIDWNGPDGNNTEGDDQVAVRYCFGTTPCPGGQPLSTLRSVNGRPLSLTLFNEIFS